MTTALPTYPETQRPVTIAAIGAGNRMQTYAHYVEQHPDKVKLVAVVEPDDAKRDALAEKFGVSRAHRFTNYRDFFANPVSADAVIIATPENEHFNPTMMALDAGYHVMLEKPIAQTYEQCLAIARKAREKGLRVGVCHVLRYHPLFVRIKELVDSGRYGQIISIMHTEEVGIDRATHSFVRGSMNREKENNPLLLAKCCHDLDFLLWITGAHCRRVSSFGSLRWFREENAPQGSADRCTRCSIEAECPFSAIDLYRRRQQWTRGFVPRRGESLEARIEEELDEGAFGRCVYRCDNNVVDNQVVTMQMTDGMLITLDINFFTQRDCRTIGIRLTEGEITCSDLTVEARHFRSRQTSVFDFSYLAGMNYHGGADMALIADFVRAVADPSYRLQTDIEGALEAHRIIFEAERSRLSGMTVTMSPPPAAPDPDATGGS
ncbi:MAG: Gfo/Idh/MocA family oxidoreductase [Paramuribaculum sp.]|nr:Gfo/Idh/MocA family oxidoreductase [Paramuribaculum sp.]MDE7471054.1 Gfo/Idh/MocA family oxidoreductase [Paramuribaculum sp.]